MIIVWKTLETTFKIMCFVSAHFLDCCIDKSDVSTATHLKVSANRRASHILLDSKCPSKSSKSVGQCGLCMFNHVQSCSCARFWKCWNHLFALGLRQGLQALPLVSQAAGLSKWSGLLLALKHCKNSAGSLHCCAKAHSATFVNHKGRLRSQRRLRTMSGSRNLRQFQTRVN